MNLLLALIRFNWLDRDRILACVLSALLIILMIPSALARGTYMSPKEFVETAFDEGKSTLSVMRLTPEIQLGVKEILGRTYPVKRIRYWKQDTRTAWIMDQIGKTEPITVGVVVDQGKIHEIKILVFRESRGAEVRHSFFTDQFLDVALQPDFSLSSQVDGITGATLSVIAVKKVARLALYLDKMADSLETP
ncbi:MAG: FMN-binding protein [Pseudomonadales bacterium]|nr:FMN-binding protein [Pseudomonadales bacterium]